VAMFDFYYGSLNKILEFFGIAGVSWLGKAPMLSLIIVNTWRGAAFVMIIFQGALRTIPSQVYEAARMDGASAWQRFWDHTLPNLRQVAALVLLSITISTFGAFLLILTLTNGGPGTKTEVIALYAYHAAFQSRQIGYGSSIAAVMLGLNLIFAAIYLRVSRPAI
jgi:multiple sugar transport system permease protein